MRQFGFFCSLIGGSTSWSLRSSGQQVKYQNRFLQNWTAMEGVNVIRTAVIKTCKLQFPYKNPNLLGHDKMHGRKGE